NGLLGSRLATRFDLVHFQVGSEGRRERLLGRLTRLGASPFLLAATIVRTGAQLLHINTSLNQKAYWRDLAYLLVGKLCGARVLYIGGLAAAKGLLETIEALRIARSRGFAARLVLAGGGPEEPRLRQYVRDAGLVREVAFVGPAYGSHKAQLLAQADVLVLASYGEGLPYS